MRRRTLKEVNSRVPSCHACLRSLLVFLPLPPSARQFSAPHFLFLWSPTRFSRVGRRPITKCPFLRRLVVQKLFLVVVLFLWGRGGQIICDWSTGTSGSAIFTQPIFTVVGDFGVSRFTVTDFKFKQNVNKFLIGCCCCCSAVVVLAGV